MTKRERIDRDVLHRRAQVAVLSGVARGDDVYDLVAAAAPSHVPGWFTPDVALPELAVTALDLACPAGVEPLEHEGLRERYLPEVTFRGRVEHRNSRVHLRLCEERMTGSTRMASLEGVSSSEGGSGARVGPRHRTVGGRRTAANGARGSDARRLVTG